MSTVDTAICTECKRPKATAEDNIRWLSGARPPNYPDIGGACWSGSVNADFGGLYPSERVADADTLRAVIIGLRAYISERTCAVVMLGKMVLNKGVPLGSNVKGGTFER